MGLERGAGKAERCEVKMGNVTLGKKLRCEKREMIETESQGPGPTVEFGVRRAEYEDTRRGGDVSSLAGIVAPPRLLSLFPTEHQFT
jgi:hypothetical protein